MADGILQLLEKSDETGIRTRAAFDRAVQEFSVPESANAYGRALGICR